LQLETTGLQRAKETATHKLAAHQMQQKAAHWEAQCRTKEQAHSEAAKINQQLSSELNDKVRAWKEERDRWAEASAQPATAHLLARSSVMLALTLGRCRLVSAQVEARLRSELAALKAEHADSSAGEASSEQDMGQQQQVGVELEAEEIKDETENGS